MTKMEKWVVRDANIVTSKSIFRGDIAVDGDIISDIGPSLSGKFDNEWNAEGRYLLPGMVDPHVHFELPVGGRFSADTFHDGSRAALFGGVTTIIDFTTPFPNLSVIESLQERLRRASSAMVDYSFHCTLSGWDETQSVSCIECGITSFKFFTAYKESGRCTEYSDLLRAAAFLASRGTIMLVHAEDQDSLRALDRFPSDSFMYYPESRPVAAEVRAVQHLREIQRETGARIYVVHVSSSSALDCAADSELILETCPHYLVLDDSVYQEPFGYRHAVAPPLRDKHHQRGLWYGIQNEKIRTIGSDHCPFSMPEQDRAGDHFTRSPFGLPGVETSLPLLVTYGIDTNRLTWQQLVSITSENPARIFGLHPRKGCLAPGSDADFIVIGDVFRVVDPIALHSNRCWSPYTGMVLRGWPDLVVSRGEIVIIGDQCLASPGRGLFLSRQPLC